MLHVVGIDIGSVALSVVLVDDKGAVVNSFYQFHYGAISLMSCMTHWLPKDGHQ